jgi:hypothetical protein
VLQTPPPLFCFCRISLIVRQNRGHKKILQEKKYIAYICELAVIATRNNLDNKELNNMTKFILFQMVKEIRI